MDKRFGEIEYEEIFLDKLSKVIVNRNYIEQNSQFWDIVIFKLWEQYYFSKREITIDSQVQSFEIIMDSVFKYHPALELPEDIIIKH